ncbi:hypothetical protein UNDKW_3446 [Undibacterium sp. KW1]|uniref:SIR2 family NAD-dependent protein deacylase n=1 Tax=Undibacterium sp. KW1 TaxID=2058624 RepID=UPI001331C5C6|nr:SIR2 family protein [Undibacterium sp. KW1]BBB61719.1 hypothetical protein UNDKW_3446 [Undibacterium sp. KW1]
MEIKLISELTDYPSIKKLASALHQFDASRHGAAIMVGAGFSRSAAHHVGGDKKMPLWDSFTKKLVAELNPADTNLNFSDPLRVAEEYRAYFGQAALNDRIRSEIDNDAWRTGELYQSLLELPWSEIMTTNWDTLLERAAEGIHGPYYTTITKPSDLTWASSPRIAKLHGTIGTTETFIAAQEDYRTYPERFAPFVNFARQVFIENELCLLGFSGDDPNFLHWTGWVRDHLADHSRKIYLVGALNLTAARRKHLESINIAPIDLWDAVKHIDDRDLMHRNATELFLAAMSNEARSKMEPHKWSPSNLGSSQVTETDLSRRFKDHDYAASLLKAQLAALKKDRESYPGWLICPPSLQWKIKSQLTNPSPNIKNVAALMPNDRAQLLYEIAWRHSITFDHIDPWLANQLFEIVNSDEPMSIGKRQRMEIALTLLKNSRWLEVNNETDQQFNQERINVLVTLLEKHSQYLPDCVAELAYYHALVARDVLDYAGVEARLEKIVGEDPVWKLRQASLTMESGRFAEGRELIAKAYGELRENHRRDRYSIPILSRLMWAHLLLEMANRGHSNRSQEVLPAFVESKYREWKCDPWDWMENIRERADEQQKEYLKNQKSIEPLFEQGYYRDNSSQRSFSNGKSVFLALDGMSRNVGLPLRLGNVNLLAGTLEKLILSGGIGAELWNLTMALRVANSEDATSIKDVFTRVGIARISQRDANSIVSRILPAIEFWQFKRSNGSVEQRGFALPALQVLIEALARLVVRLTSEEAKNIFRLAVTLGRQPDFQHILLCTVLKSLLTNSLKSIPKSGQGELLTDALTFPLPSEVRTDVSHYLPMLVIDYPNARDSYPSLEKQINELISPGPNGLVSNAALLRLLPLCKKEGFLTDGEREKLADILWGTPPTYENLPYAGKIYPHAFLYLPAPDAEKVKALLRHHLFEHDEAVLIDTQKKLRSFPSIEIERAIMIYSGIAHAAVSTAGAVFPTPEQAIVIFDRLMEWRPWKGSDDTFGLETREQTRLADSIGNALAYAIVPMLAKEARSTKRFQKLKLFYEEVNISISVMPAFAYFASISEDIADFAEKMIRKSLHRHAPREVSYAAITLQKWIELPEAADLPQFDRLISRLMVIIESGRKVGLQQLLRTVGDIFKKSRLSSEQVAILIEAIPEIFDANDYANIDPAGEEAITASSLRVECVKLAKVFFRKNPDATSLKGLLEKALTDALPEVRFAIDETE